MKTAVAIGGFADLWLYSETDYRARKRDLRASVIADPCQTCGAEPGKLCTRPTIAGPVLRQMPHVGRGGPSLRAHNATYRT